MTQLAHMDHVARHGGLLPMGFHVATRYVSRVMTLKETPQTGHRAINDDSAELEALVIAIAERRDRIAFGELFDRLTPRLKGFLFKHGMSESQTDDLIQEVMLKVWRNAGQFDPTRGKVSTWLFTITRNMRIDHLRKEIRPKLDPEDPMLTPAPDEPADDQIHYRQTADRVAEAVSGLPDDQTQILQLAFFEELSHSEISNRLDLPLGTVKSRIRLAFGRLRTALSELDR